MVKKFFLSMIIYIVLLSFVIPIYADDEIEEIDISKQEIEEIRETAVDVTKIPTINSRYAIIYDRTSRKNFIWKTGKCKM